MEKKSTVKKTTSRAKINIAIPTVVESSKTTKKSTRKSTSKQVESIVKDIKKADKGLILGIILALVAGILLGAFVLYNVISKNDCFELNGNDEIMLTLEEKYEEKGVRIIEFNKDISDQVKIETDLVLDGDGKPTEEGMFYVKYTVDSIKYGKIFTIEKIRLVFVEASEGGE